MWRTLAAVALGIAGALYVTAHRPVRPVADLPGWWRLPNGLRFAVRPIAGATDVAVLTYFEIGSDHDPDGRSGLAHLTEHLYVTAAAGATDARTAQEWLEEYGAARCAAETTQACTIYMTKVRPGSLDAEVADAAARMSDLRIEAADLDRERPRVLQQIAEKTAAAGRPPSPAAWIAAVERIHPLIGPGVPGNLRATTLDEVRERARRFYGPANARLVLTGAVDETEAKRIVAKCFAGVPGGQLEPTARRYDPVKAGGRIDLDCGRVRPGEAAERAVWIAWPGPSRNDPDAVALQLLERRTGSSFPEPRKFQAMSSLVEGVVLLHWSGDEVPVEDVVQAADELVARFAAEPPTQDEIDSLAPGPTPGRDRYEFTAVAGFPEMLAFALASDASRHRDPDRERRTLESLTKDDLARLAAKWLAPENCVVAVARGPARPPGPMPPYMKEVFKKAGTPVEEPDDESPSPPK